MRISDWSSDVCSSDLRIGAHGHDAPPRLCGNAQPDPRAGNGGQQSAGGVGPDRYSCRRDSHHPVRLSQRRAALHLRAAADREGRSASAARSEEHTSELQSLMRISYAVFCLKKKITIITKSITQYIQL